MAQLFQSHRGDELLVVPHPFAESGVRGAVAPEVGPHGKYDADGCGQCEQAAEEGLPVLGVSTKSKHFFELVDDHHGGLVTHRRERLVKPRVGLGAGSQRGGLKARLAVEQRGDETGQHERRLAAARGAQHREERVPFQSLIQSIDPGLAGEKEGAVRPFERLQTFERAAGVVGPRLHVVRHASE